MSSSKRFEKTFSRKNKDKDKDKDNKNPDPEQNQTEDEDEQVLLCALAATSKRTHTTNGATTSQTPKKQKPRDKPTTKETPQKKKYKPDKQEAQKQKKVKVENGDADADADADGDDKQVSNKKKKNVTPTKRNSKTSKKEGKEKEQRNYEGAFPTNRIVRIIKSEASHSRLSSDAVFLINKATEKFIELFSKDAYDLSVQERKSFVAYKHLATTVSQEKRLDFLSDFVPEKLTAEKALAERKPVEKLPA